MNNQLAEFESISAETQIPLPPMLKDLLASGATEYGPDWQSTYRERILNNPPAFINFGDFEWIDAETARLEIKSWLIPQVQGGRRFLPFAQSGAGDMYCLMPYEAPDGQQLLGVSLVWHDSDSSQIDHASFRDFVCSHYLEAFADLNELVGNYSIEGALQAIRADVSQATRFMSDADREYLESFCRPELLQQRPFQSGPRRPPEACWSLLSEEQLRVEVQKLPSPDITFDVIAPWEVPNYEELRSGG